MKFIPKYITTDILAEYGEHLTHEAYNEMVKLNSTQGDYNTTILNQLFNTDEGIQIPYLDKKIKKVTDDQLAINEDMDQIVADMKALAGSLSKYTTICETRRMIQYATQDFVKTNKIKAGENVEVVVDALNNVIISATGGGDVTKEYVDEHDASTLYAANNYTDNAISQIDLDDYATTQYVDDAIAQIDLDDYATKNYVDNAIADIPIPVVPTDISAFNNDVGYITDYTETDPVFGASPAADITAQDIFNWNSKDAIYLGDVTDFQNNATPLDFTDLDFGTYIIGVTNHSTNPWFYAKATYGGVDSAVHQITFNSISGVDILILQMQKKISDTTPSVSGDLFGYIVGQSWHETNKQIESRRMNLKMYFSSNTYSVGTSGSSYINFKLLTTDGTQTITGQKTFNILPESSVTPTTANQLVNKTYVDTAVAGAGGGNVNYLGDIENYTAQSRLDLNTLDAGVYIFNNIGPLAKLYIEGTNDNIQFTADIPVDTGNNTYVVPEAFFTLYSKIEDLILTSTRVPFATFHYMITDGSDVLNRYVVLTIRKDNGVIYVESPTNNKQFLNVVRLSSNQTITGRKTFTTLPESSVTPTTANQLTNKAYVDSVAGGGSNNKIVAIDTNQNFVVADMPVENCVNTIFRQINMTIKGESTSESSWNISNTHLLSYRVLADYSTATDGDPIFALVMFIENADGTILVNYETFSKDTTNPTGLSLSSIQDPTYSIPAKYWFFDEDKQPHGFGQTDVLHFINANRYQTPFVFENKELGLYAFTPNGVYGNSILGHCFKGTSSNTSYYEIPCLFLLIVKEYNSAANEDDIAIGFGAGDHGPITFGFKKDTTQASGIKRTNLDYFNPSLYVSTFSNETINGVKTFGTLPKISSATTPTNMLQLVPYGFLLDKDAATYNTANTYNKGDFVRYQNKMYQCKTDGTTGTWNSTNWTETTTDVLNNIINYINNKNSYSTSETRIGTWTDGKPIYRKVINITEFPSQEASPGSYEYEKTYSTGLTNVDTVVNLTGSYHNTNTSATPSTTIPLNFFVHIDNSEFVSTRLSQDSSDITIRCSSFFKYDTSVTAQHIYQGHVVIEYTKTTD